MKHKLSIIIPVYNEEKILEKVIFSLKKNLDDIEIEYEFIAVNDCSKDKSLEILRKIDYVKTLNHSVNKGYGASLKTGIKNSKYDWIMIIDADGTYPTSSVGELIKHMTEFDQIIGARITKNNAIPLNRRHAKKFLNHLAGYISGKKIPDLNSGLRIFRKEMVMKYWELFPQRFSFTSTLTMISLNHGYSTIFIPIDYYKREGKSSIKAKDFFSFFKLIAKLSLFFKPIKIFAPLALIILLPAILLTISYIAGIVSIFYDSTITILTATALQTFFFGLLAEIIIHNK